jgi:hypothetical protein
MRWLAPVFAGAAFGLCRSDGHTRAIHFDIQHRDIASRDLGQIELHGALDFSLFAALDIAADGFGVPFDGLARDLQARQQLHLLAALIKRGVAAHHRHHAPHAGRVLGVEDVEFPVARALPVMAGGAAVISPLEPHWPDSGEHMARPLFAIPRGLSASAGDRSRHWPGLV